ncbi:MAG: archease [Candidatus Omnitrophica bacterium]|nr:archease [Candidatus Omnitrophota bacterium]
MKNYKQIPHTADVAALIRGNNLPKLFENAAYAMFDLMADLNGLVCTNTQRIEVEASDTESLLIAWLNEVLYAGYKKSVLFYEFNIVSLYNNKLIADVKGQMIEEDDRIKLGIKAATYHDVVIKETIMGYEVAIVFDV